MLEERTVGGLHEALLPRVRWLGLDVNAPVLDLGCGTGAWLARLGGTGMTRLYGVDRDISAVGFPGASYREIDLDEGILPSFDVERFPLITAIEVIEHLANPGNFLSVASRLLAPGGRLLITTPNLHSVLCRLRFLLSGRLKQFDEKGDQTHIYPVLVSAFNQLLPRYNLGIEELWPFPADGSSPTTVSMPLAIGAKVLKRVLPEILAGDMACMFVRPLGCTGSRS